MIKVCEQCGGEYKTTHKSQRFCSKDCKYASQMVEDPEYRAMHIRVRVARGKASQFPCIDGCGRQARHWSQRHGTDGLNTDDYDPRCTFCHSRYDIATRPRGEQSGLAKLTDDDVRAIRASVGVTQVELAKRYKVSRFAIQSILRGKTWRHVK